jgi:MFS family permease
MFVVGIGVFTTASLLAGLAPTAAWLVAARSLQGVGAANPSSSRCPARSRKGSPRSR